MTSKRPSWQSDDCPAWCAGGHAEHDQPDDWVHRSEEAAVPTIVRAADGEIAAAEIEVGLSRRDGTRETWLYLGDGPRHQLELTLESGHRLMERLVSMLE